MMADVRDQEREWLTALDHPAIRAKGLGPEVVGPALAGARARVLERLLRTLVHGHLLGDGPVEPQADGRLTVPLPKSGRSLVIECLTWFEQGLAQRFGRIHLVEGGCTTLIEEPVELIAVLAAEAADGSDDSLARFAEEMSDCVRNEGLCATYRSAWNQRIAAMISTAKADGYWPWLVAGRTGVDASLFLEQWGAVGTLYSPGHKVKLGLQPHEVVAWSPEFEGRVRIRLAAVRRTHVHIETMPGIGSIENRLERDLPDWLAAWRERLKGGGLDPDGFVPVPVHPWQADNVLPKLFADAIAGGDVALLDGPELECASTMSFRTVVPGGRADMPHIKVPVAILLTGNMRTISPRTFEMGPRISRLLQDILADDPGFDGSLVILPEEIGIHYRDEGDGELGKNLGVLIRPNPAQYTAADEIAVPVASLCLPSPGTGIPLFTELARTAGATSPLELRRAFRAYAGMLLGCATRLYLVHGIALGSHQQNCLAVFGANGALRRIMVRDFGGVRIHRPTLLGRGRQLQIHPDRLTVVESWDDVRSNFVHHVPQLNLGGLAAALAGDDVTAARAFWAEIAEATKEAFDDVRSDVPGEFWHTERRAVLEDDWPVRATTRMRIAGTGRIIYVAGRNPLATVKFRPCT